MKDHKIFIGWFKTDGTEFDSFVEEGTLNADATTVLTAKYETVYYVFYKADNTEGSKILYTQTYHNANDSIVADGVPFAVPSGKALIGWSVNSNATTPDQNLKLAGDDVTLYPVVAAAHWISYDTQGGTILDPTYVLANDVTVEPATNPTKVGYEFAGWFKDDTCMRDFTFGSPLNEDIKLYAKWIPGTAKYTVIHWWENADDDGYSYHETEQRNGTTGQQTNAAGKTYTVTDKDIYGTDITKTDVFTAQPIVQKTIEGDGSTIVNVYYTRAKYQLIFRAGSSRGQELKTIEKKYGQKIDSTEWPKHKNKKIDSNGVSSWEIKNSFLSATYLAYSSTMPLGGGTLWTYGTYGSSVYATYMTENLNDSNYSVHHIDSAFGYNLRVSEEDAYGITGFTFEKAESNNLKYDGAKFYYKRNSYNVVYHNGGKVENKSPYKFEADISMAGAFIPKHPAKVESDYTFAGWYQDPEGTTPYNFEGKTMPANDIIVYAKWAAPTYTVKFDLNGATSVGAYSDQTVEKGKLATKPADPTRDEYTFAGWTKNGSPFSFQTQITENTTLTAQWISNKKYPLTYVSNNGKTTTLADGEFYAVGAEAKVIEVPKSDGWEALDGMKEFLCWNTDKDGNGTDYYPGDSFEMPENLTDKGAFLYAKWVPKRETTLNYNLNYEGADPELYGKTIIKVPNEPYAIGSNSDDPAKNDPTRDGYRFLGWSTNPTSAAGEKLLQKNSKIQVDTIKEAKNNVLYAQWQKLKEVTFTVEKLVEGNMGEHNREFEFTYSIIDKEGAVKGSDTFKLKSSDSTELPKVAEGYTIVIQETLATGYTTTINADVNNESKEAGKFSYMVTKDSSDAIKVTYTNSKTMVTPTGVTTNGMTSILMLLAGLGMAVVMLLTGKRRKI